MDTKQSFKIQQWKSGEKRQKCRKTVRKKMRVTSEAPRVSDLISHCHRVDEELEKQIGLEIHLNHQDSVKNREEIRPEIIQIKGGPDGKKTKPEISLR
ncbi:hypothetical protein Baya_13778 [Bagarius yarrelli]|uniref:Uncharacterized protein n=1 Tax=Bagarius yarrelli TaxID=175774 RepID=A0A556V7H4_BAGYA|nr:hypothetical protein Baya_13778 [Bagarius yarrelli]